MHNPRTLGTTLEWLQINTKFLCRCINGSKLIDSLDSLGRKAKPDIPIEIFREETLPLEVNLLDLLDTPVREGNYTSLTVGPLAQQITDSCPHFHRSSPTTFWYILHDKNEQYRGINRISIDPIISEKAWSFQKTSPRSEPLHWRVFARPDCNWTQTISHHRWCTQYRGITREGRSLCNCQNSENQCYKLVHCRLLLLEKCCWYCYTFRAKFQEQRWWLLSNKQRAAFDSTMSMSVVSVFSMDREPINRSIDWDHARTWLRSLSEKDSSAGSKLSSF